jgi:hypothetical protein
MCTSIRKPLLTFRPVCRVGDSPYLLPLPLPLNTDVSEPKLNITDDVWGLGWSQVKWWVKIKWEQAGLSRATLEISSEFSSEFPLRTHKSQSIQWLLRYSPFEILRSASVVDRLHFKDLKIHFWRSKLQFKIWAGSNKWLLRCSTFNIANPRRG